MAKTIVNHLPEHRHYVEPFAGSLAVLLAKPASKLETVNDLDAEIVSFWRVLRDQPEELARLASLTPHSRLELELSRDRADLTDLEHARRVWVQLSQGRTGTLRKTGWRFFSNPSGTSSSMPRYLQGYVDRIMPAAERLRNVSLECRPALDLIEKYGTESEACIYADPPYLGETRATGYREELLDSDSHETLASALNACRSAVVLSGYASPLYEHLYAGWRKVEVKSGTGQSNGYHERTEVLWINR